jgi:hypothetical protein
LNKLEKLFNGLMIGAIAPLCGFLAGWWIFCKSLSNMQIALTSASGLVLGLIVDALFLKKWTAQAYQASPMLWMSVYLFYSICVFGFFMGVPVFNVLLAIPAGIFSGARLSHLPADAARDQAYVRRAQRFTTAVMALICAASAFLALRDPTTAANLEGMLRLPFRVTTPMIIALIAVGGIGLLLVQWFLTAKSIALGRRLSKQSA